ncbi:MAG: hypothetical protein P8Y71_06000 [Pseudolabrys sp.]
MAHGAEDTGQRDRRAHGVFDRAFARPNLAAGFEIGGDGRERFAVTFDFGGDVQLLEQGDDLLAADQAAAAQPHVEQADDVAPGEFEREHLQGRELAGDIGRA